MKNLFYIIGFVLACILTVTMYGCNTDVEYDPLTDSPKPDPTKTKPKVTWIGAIPSSGSTIDHDSEILLNFTGFPENVSVNKGTLVNEDDGYKIKGLKGPFIGNQLALEVKWDGGSKALKYFFRVEYIKSDPPIGSTLKPRDHIVISFQGFPKNVRGGAIGIPKFRVSGDKVITNEKWWDDEGVLEFDIHWDGDTREAGGKKIFRYNLYRGPLAYIDRVARVLEKEGIRIIMDFTVGRMRNENGRVSVYFYFSNGKALNDFNGKFNTVGGKVSLWEDFRPGFEVTWYDNFVLFIPYSELHLAKGVHDLEFRVKVRNQDTGKFIQDQSRVESFSLKVE